MESSPEKPNIRLTIIVVNAIILLVGTTVIVYQTILTNPSTTVPPNSLINNQAQSPLDESTATTQDIPSLFPGIHWQELSQDIFVYWKYDTPDATEPKQVEVYGEWRNSDPITGTADDPSAMSVSDALTKYYEEEFSRRGWTPGFSADSGAGSMWGYSKGDNIFVIQNKTVGGGKLNTQNIMECTATYPCATQFTLFHN